MAFNLNRIFSKPKADQAEQPQKLFNVLDAQTKATLDEIKYTYQQTNGFTGEQIAFLSKVRKQIENTHGEEAYKEALADYMKSETLSRLEELREVVNRNDLIKTTLMKSLAAGDTEALERAKQSLKVLSSDTFSRFDVEAYCAELATSEAFAAFKRAQDDAVITRVSEATGMNSQKNESFISPYAGDRPRHYASEDSIHSADDTVIDWQAPTEEFQPGKPERETL